MKYFVSLFIVISFISSYHAAAASQYGKNKSGGHHSSQLEVTTSILSLSRLIGNIFDEILKTLVAVLRHLLSVIIKNTLNIINNVVPPGTRLNVKHLIVILKTLKNPTTLTVITKILKSSCKADNCIVSKVVPKFILNTRININAFIKRLLSQCKSTTSVTFPFIINVISDYLINVYSIRLH